VFKSAFRILLFLTYGSDAACFIFYNYCLQVDGWVLLVNTACAMD